MGTKQDKGNKSIADAFGKKKKKKKKEDDEPGFFDKIGDFISAQAEGGSFNDNFQKSKRVKRKKKYDKKDK